MNNIEILEEWLKEMDEHFKRTHINNTKEREALRFIIQENKELKKENLELHKEINQRIKLKLENERCADKDFIPKSKVKEKIEELDKKMAKDEVDEFGIHSQGWAALDWTRDFLLKLLEEGE